MTLRTPKIDLRGFSKAFPLSATAEVELRGQWEAVLSPWASFRRSWGCFFKGHSYCIPLVCPPMTDKQYGCIFFTCAKCGSLRSVPVKIDIQWLSGQHLSGKELLS